MHVHYFGDRDQLIMLKQFLTLLFLLSIATAGCIKSDSDPDNTNRWIVDGKLYSSPISVFNASNSLAASTGSGSTSAIVAVEFFWAHKPDRARVYSIVDHPDEEEEVGVFVLHEEKTYESVDSSSKMLALEMVNGKMSVRVPPIYLQRTYATTQDSVLVEASLLQTY